LTNATRTEILLRQLDQVQRAINLSLVGAVQRRADEFDQESQAGVDCMMEWQTDQESWDPEVDIIIQDLTELKQQVQTMTGLDAREETSVTILRSMTDWWVFQSNQTIGLC
jgi:hypothetical protein